MRINSLSFCCVVKNEENYIEELVESLLNVSKYINSLEFIFIDDFSKDSTYDILKRFSKKDIRFKVVKNTVPGKVCGTNLALNLCSKEFVKFVDGDDVLDGDYNLNLGSFDCLYHDYRTLENHKKQYIKIGNWLSESPHVVSSNFRSIPKAMFIFKTTFIKKYFPIPDRLPFEDLWINLAASESKKIIYLEDSMYLYRQHNNQFYGALSNFNSQKKIRMADRFIKYYDYLSNNDHPFNFLSPNIEIKFYAEALSSNNFIAYLKLLKFPKLFFKAIFYNFSFVVRLIWRSK